jgi:CrcB protein
MAYLWVALGGAAGAATRYGVVQWTGGRLGWTFPWGTLAVNVTGLPGDRTGHDGTSRARRLIQPIDFCW